MRTSSVCSLHYAWLEQCEAKKCNAVECLITVGWVMLVACRLLNTFYFSLPTLVIGILKMQMLKNKHSLLDNYRLVNCCHAQNHCIERSCHVQGALFKTRFLTFQSKIRTLGTSNDESKYIYILVSKLWAVINTYNNCLGYPLTFYIQNYGI